MAAKIANIVYFCRMEIVSNNPVGVTPGAVIELKKLMKSATPGEMVRFGVKGGGCSGMSYTLGFDQKTSNDLEFEIEGIPCLLNKAHEIYLFGMVIDWENGLNNRGFTYKNPNASTTCGCGTSFAV
jgi:iron-sulfur cluster assembly protein